VWRHPAHAALCTAESDSKKEIKVSDDLEIHHFPVSKTRPDYLSLLELSVRECRCPRTMFYLGREYFFRKRYSAAMRILEEYLASRESNWRAQRAEAMRMIAASCRALNQPDRGLTFAVRAIAECPGVRDLWYELLRHFYMTNDFEGGSWAAHRCLELSKRCPQYISHHAEAWGPAPYILGSRSFLKVGRSDRACEIIGVALDLFPQSPEVHALALECGLTWTEKT
jgi:hypothetical protein